MGCGLGALLQTSEQLFSVVKWLGAAYLLYLAWGMWRAPAQPLRAEALAGGGQARRRSGGRCWLVCPTPRACCFLGFLPQFIRPDALMAEQYLVLALISAVVDCLMMSFVRLWRPPRHAHVFGQGDARVNLAAPDFAGRHGGGLTLYRRSDAV